MNLWSSLWIRFEIPLFIYSLFSIRINVKWFYSTFLLLSEFFFTIYNMIFNQFNATGLNASNEKMIGFRDTQITSYHFSCRLIKANFIFSYKLLHCWEMRNVKNAKKHIFEVSAFNKHEDMKSQYNKRKLNAILNVHILYDMYVCNFNFL